MGWRKELWAKFVVAYVIIFRLKVAVFFTIVGEDCKGSEMVIEPAIAVCAGAPGAIFNSSSRVNGVLFLKHACLIGCHSGNLHTDDCQSYHKQAGHD